MKFQFLTRVNKYKRFQFTPRFYDERKERLDAMVKQYTESAEDEENDAPLDELDYRRKEALRSQMQQSWSRSQSRAAGQKRSNIRVVLIILALLALSYFILRNTSNEEKPIIHQID